MCGSAVADTFVLTKNFSPLCRPQVVKELQTSAREAIVLLRAMIGEVCLNVEEEESAICSLFNSLQVME